jgi:hypothetical protein
MDDVSADPGLAALAAQKPPLSAFDEGSRVNKGKAFLHLL